MFPRTLKSISAVAIQNGAHNFSTSIQTLYKVVVVGAAGGIGQPLSMLLKMNPRIRELACFDLAKITPGVVIDLSHIDTPPNVTAYVGPNSLIEALHCADIVVIPAGVPRKPGMSRDDLFNTNASIVREVTKCIAEYAPRALIAIITNPVNSVVPVAAEVLKKACVYDWRRVFGVTTLDVVRAASFVAEINCIDPRNVTVPVIGGHAGITIIPVLSQCVPPVKLYNQAAIEGLTKRIQEAGTEVVNAKGGGGSATLSMAYAAGRFINSLLKGLSGEYNIECAYIKSALTDATHFANQVKLGPCGVVENLGFCPLNAYETQLVLTAVPELVKDIQKGEKFVRGK